MIILLLFLVILFFPKNAYAYLDPGTGSYIFQFVIAIILGLIFSLKLFWKKIVRTFLRLLKGKQRADEK